MSDEWVDLGPWSTAPELETAARKWVETVERDGLAAYNPPVHPHLMVAPLLAELDRLRAVINSLADPQVNDMPAPRMVTSPPLPRRTEVTPGWPDGTIVSQVSAAPTSSEGPEVGQYDGGAA